VREVVDGVFELSTVYVHLHLVVVDDGVVLVDTGIPGRADRVERALGDIRRKIGDVRTILLTHQHVDHTGGVAELRRRSGARVVAHAADAPVIRGDVEPVIKHPLVKLVGMILGKPEPSTVDEVLTGDGASPVPGFTAIHTPGHTAGHVSYLLARAGGILFAGDAAAGGRGRIGSTPKMVSADLDHQAASVAKLAALDFEHAVFGHGPAVPGRAVDRFREYVSARSPQR
jgi:glyoxylase-like metal-dependent hydrolase (beta-lactamase superfamily II)